MTISIPEAILDDLARAARAAAPAEACGLLAGSGSRVARFYPLANADGSAEHFSMRPEEQFAAVRDMRKNGWAMLAVWHSHPASPPRMSREDLRLAFTPGVLYAITSLADAAGPETRAFRVDGGEPRPVEVLVEPEAGPCRLPESFAGDIDAHEQDVRRFLSGEMPPAVFRAKRVPRGIYEQRQDGTYMVRVRVPGGALGAAQARALAEIALAHGNGLLHVTTRQDVQIHDVPIADTPAVFRRLLEAGLSSRGGGGNTVRNVTACPLAGICPHERFDVSPFARAVTEYLLPLAGSYNLPRKYKIAFSGCPADCAQARFNDLGFVAAAGGPGFAAYAGGGMGAYSRLADLMEERLPAAEVVRAAEAVRRLFDRLGNRRDKRQARLRFVLDRMGPQAFREAFRREMDAALRGGVPECAARAAAGTPPAAPASFEACWRTGTGGLRMARQRQEGFAAVRLPLPLGFAPAGDFIKIAGIAEKFSPGKGLRTTQRQDLILHFVREERLGELAESLRSLETDVVSFSPLERFVSCAGASTCRLGLCLSRNAARACAGALGAAGIGREVLGRMDVHVSGCPDACGLHPAGPIGLSGAALRVDGRLVPAYRVLLGGRRGEAGARLAEGAETVPARALPGLLADLAADFRGGRTGEEDFNAYFDRKGMSHFLGLIRRHRRVPSREEDPSYYRDWGAEEDFSLAGRGAGECGAGVFDVIVDDIAAARKALSAGGGFEALLPAARALLITRGVDSRDPAEVLKAFERHFLETGLVGAEFAGLVSRARGFLEGRQDALDGQGEEVRRLLERVELLYSTLDASLSFHPPEAAGRAGPARPAAEGGGTAELDLRGVACPMNFVKAKLKLETMEGGAVLGLFLDEGEPVENVPASFRGEGQEVLDMQKVDGGHWRVMIRRKS